MTVEVWLWQYDCGSVTVLACLPRIKRLNSVFLHQTAGERTMENAFKINNFIYSTCFLFQKKKEKKKELIHLVHVKSKCQFMHGLCYKVTTIRIGSFQWNESTILCTLFLICFARFAKFNVDRVSPKHLQQVKQSLNSQCADFGWTYLKIK